MFLIVCLFNIPATIQTVKKAVFFYDYALPKIVVAFFASFYFRLLSHFVAFVVQIAKKAFAKFHESLTRNEQERPIDEETFAGVPIVELVDYMFETRHFKRAELEERFAMSRANIDLTAKRLEELCVLIRGENNARILASDFSRADIVEMFRKAKNPQSLSLIRRMTDDGEYTYKPRMQEIKNRVLSSLSGFSITPIQKTEE